jgi:hypothetical protein
MQLLRLYHSLSPSFSLCFESGEVRYDQRLSSSLLRSVQQKRPFNTTYHLNLIFTSLHASLVTLQLHSALQFSYGGRLTVLQTLFPNFPKILGRAEVTCSAPPLHRYFHFRRPPRYLVASEEMNDL